MGGGRAGACTDIVRAFGQAGTAACCRSGEFGCGERSGGQTLDPRPRDFQDVAAFKRGFDVEAIAHTLATGILVPAAPATGATGAPSHHQQGMPKFDPLSEVERQSLALFVISLHDPARQGARQP